MLTAVKPIKQTEKEQAEIKWYDIPFPATTYTYPEDNLIEAVEFGNSYIHLHLTDGRIISIPLWWLPTVYHAAPEERAKFTISPDRKRIIWDPDHGAINDELTLQDYLVNRSKG